MIIRPPILTLGALGLVLFLQTLGSAPARSADSDGQFAIKGGGLQTCESFLKSYDARSNDLSVYGGWVEGYMTGQNQRLNGTYDLIPWQETLTIIGALSSVCQNLPRDTRFIDALDQLVRAFLPSRLPSSSAVFQVRTGDQTTVMYADVFDLISSRLRQLGYDTPIDPGVFSDETRAALRSYQTDNSLPATGHPDQRTLFQLFVTSFTAQQR